MIEPSKAVFLSYASEDAEAARRICGALRAAGIEVWFDESELRGGDVWDHKIRQQIRDCALFIPIVSANTQARPEGYFRLEWRLADQRTHLMGRSRAFLVPVCIDDTPDVDADAPDSFLAVQWTRLTAGEDPTAFVERVNGLLFPDQHLPPAPLHSAAQRRSAPASTDPGRLPAAAWRSQRALLLIAAVAVIGGAYLTVDKFVLSKHSVVSLSPPSAIPEKSIAVLPFADMSEKKDQEYFSDGLSEELIDLLSQVQDLRVPARTSSFFFKGKQVTIAEIAKALGVAHVLEGSVRKSGDTLRVTVQLIRADNGYHLWSKTYDGNTKDIFKVQDAVAAAVVEVLKGKLVPGQVAVSYRTANPEAYNQYLLGRQYDRRGDFRRAVEAYSRVIALDPNYAAAYAGLAIAEGEVADTGDESGLKRAEATAEKAVALAPEEADGYTARGELRFTHRGDWAGGQADLEKALSLNPADGRAQLNYGWLLFRLGQVPEAMAAARKAVELDPLRVGAWQALSLGLLITRDYRGADEAVRRALAIDPEDAATLSILSSVQLLEGHPAEALMTARTIDDEATRLRSVAFAEHSLGHARESQQALDQLIAKHAADSAYMIAQAFAWLGDKDQAFAWLERAWRQHDGGLHFIKIDGTLASLHGDPRYTALLRKMNLPE